MLHDIEDVKYGSDVLSHRERRQNDNSGNTTITQKWVESGDISTATNRYSSGVTYDAAGNITVDPRFRNLIYGYDANGRQNYSAAANGSGPVTAIFDGAGQRVANKAGGVMNIMVYDAGGKLVAEYGATAPTTANLQYVTADYQGSTRVVTNSSGVVANRRDYLPFGEEIGATVVSRADKGFGAGDMARQKYAGMESDDATNMAHTLWRKQDNWSGRWTSPDPYGGSMTIADPQSFNRYTYVNNDPVNQVDSLGLYSNNYHDGGKGSLPYEEEEEEPMPRDRRSSGDPHLSGSSSEKTGESRGRDNNWKDGKVYSGYKRVKSRDKVHYEWVNDRNVHDVPNNYVYIDTQGRVIQLYGEDDTNFHSWGVMEANKDWSSDQVGNGPEGPLFYHGVEGALLKANYVNFVDLILEHILADNYARENGPTLHISLFSISGRSGEIGNITVHEDKYSPVNQKCKHVAFETVPKYIKKYAPKTNIIIGPYPPRLF